MVSSKQTFVETIPSFDPDQKWLPSQEQFYTEYRWIENWRHEHGKKTSG
jgi:hypothetical protein